MKLGKEKKVKKKEKNLGKKKEATVRSLRKLQNEEERGRGFPKVIERRVISLGEEI